MSDNHYMNGNFTVAYSIDTTGIQMNGNAHGYGYYWHFGYAAVPTTWNVNNDNYGAVGNAYIGTNKKETHIDGTMANWNYEVLPDMVGEQQEREHSQQQQQQQQQQKQYPSPMKCVVVDAFPNCAVCKRPVRNVSNTNGTNNNNNSNGDIEAEHICDGCVRFFKRCIAKREFNFSCIRDSQCCLPDELLNCPLCRLNRCLLIDMDANAAYLPRHQSRHYKWIEERKAALRNESMEASGSTTTTAAAFNLDNANNDNSKRRDNASIPDQHTTHALIVQPQTNMQDWAKLNFLCMCEQRQKANWDTWTEIPAWIFKIKSLEQLLHGWGNFLTKHNESVDCRHHKMAGNEQYTDSSWTSSPAATNAICIDVLLLLEWTKQMPVFAQLETADQLILLKHIHKAFTGMINTYYSKQANAKTWIRANGHVLFCPETNGSLWEDERFRFLGKQYFCAGVEVLNQMDIGREEFALLLSIICCNSNAAGLSAAGRELLYNQSADYSRVLMKFLQQKSTHESGAKKFADCMRLVELMFQMRYRYEMFVVYRDMCRTIRRTANATTVKCPKALSMFSPYYNCQN